MTDYHVQKMTQYVPVRTLGYDEQGRPLVTCPTCREPATVQDDDSIICPQGQAEAEFIRQGIAKLLETGPSFLPSPEERE